MRLVLRANARRIPYDGRSDQPCTADNGPTRLGMHLPDRIVLVFCLEGELRDVRLSEIHSKRLILNSAAGGDGISWAPILCGSIPGWVPWRMLIFVIGWLRRYLVVYGVISWFFLSISTVLDGSISKSLVATGVQMLFLIDVDEMLLNYLLVGSFKNAFEGGTTVATTPSDERARMGAQRNTGSHDVCDPRDRSSLPELMTGVGRYYLDSVGYFGHGLPSQVSTSLLTTSGFHAGAIVWVSHTIEKAARLLRRGGDSRASQLSRISPLHRGQCGRDDPSDLHGLLRREYCDGADDFRQWCGCSRYEMGRFGRRDTVQIRRRARDDVVV